jgi:hypothetical protein
LIGYLVCQLIDSPEHCRYPSFHKRLKDWLAHFNGVASKYLDNYLAWFRFLDSKGFEKTKENLKYMLYTSCLNQMRETYKSLRLSEFRVA